MPSCTSEPPSEVGEENPGETLYVKMCEAYHVVPVSYFLRNMGNRTLRMKYHGLGPKGTKAIAVPLQVTLNVIQKSQYQYLITFIWCLYMEYEYKIYVPELKESIMIFLK